MKRFTLVLVVVVVALALPMAAFAQSTTTLDITTANITPNLFLGANIMITALLSIMMLVAGFAFGLGILKAVVGAITKGIR